MRIILAAGGSGGHIFPAIALARALEEKGIKEIRFISSKRRLDRRILEGTPYNASFLSVNPMPRDRNPVKLARFFLKLIGDMAYSFVLLFRERPDAVAGFGGYSSGAICLSAKILNIPVLIHEQNLLPGIANKVLCRFADRIAVSFEQTTSYFDGKARQVVFTGNPVRMNGCCAGRGASIFRLGLPGDVFTVLIMGGSQGSSYMNAVASRSARKVFEEKGEQVQFIHLTGKKDYNEVKDFYESNAMPAIVLDFLENMEDAYSACDLAISRSGASAIFELACYSRPMILVPYPDPENNQIHNARFFEEKGAAVLKEERELDEEGLADVILDLFNNGGKRKMMGERARELGPSEAENRLADEVIKILKKK